MKGCSYIDGRIVRGLRMIMVGNFGHDVNLMNETKERMTVRSCPRTFCMKLVIIISREHEDFSAGRLPRWLGIREAVAMVAQGQMPWMTARR